MSAIEEKSSAGKSDSRDYLNYTRRYAGQDKGELFYEPDLTVGILNQLIEHKINDGNYNPARLLFSSCIYGNADIIQYYLDNHADYTISEWYSLGGSHRKAVNKLCGGSCDVGKSEPLIFDEYKDWTPMHFALSLTYQNGHANCFKILLDYTLRQIMADKDQMIEKNITQLISKETYGLYGMTGKINGVEQLEIIKICINFIISNAGVNNIAQVRKHNPVRCCIKELLTACAEYQYYDPFYWVFRSYALFNSEETTRPSGFSDIWQCHSIFPRFMFGVFLGESIAKYEEWVRLFCRDREPRAQVYLLVDKLPANAVSIEYAMKYADFEARRKWWDAADEKTRGIMLKIM